MVARKFQIFKYQLFSLTSVLPDEQKIVGVDENRVLYDDLDLVSISERLRLVSVNDEVKQSQPESAGNDAALGMSDEELARMLQAEEEALMLQQYVAPENTGDFERQIRPYVDKVRMDWELEMIDSFMTLLYSRQIRQGVADSLCWTPSSRGLFEVRSFYSIMIHPSSQVSFPWKGVWKAKVPPRVAFFVWTSALGKILTTDNLRKRRVIIQDWCCMCKSSGESVNHLLLHCPVAWELWSMVLILFGITWVMPRGVVDLLNCWHGPRSKSEAGKIWKMTPHCLMWCIWQERNDRTFNGEEKSIPALKFHLLHILLSWAKAAHLDSSCSLSDMIDYCSYEDSVRQEAARKTVPVEELEEKALISLAKRRGIPIDMSIRLVSWNVRGLNEGSKRLTVRNLLRQWKADLVCLQETKLQSMSRSLIRSLWGGHHVDWLFVGSNGASGGLLILWDKRCLEKVDEALGLHTASCKFRCVASGFEWAFTGVYGPHDVSARRVFWEEMAGVHSWWDVPWVVGGDFNVVRFPSERLGATHLTTAMQDFSDFISSTGLMDIHMVGGRYTWSNSQSRSRLDRFLFTPTVEDHFTLLVQRRLPRLVSDHFPILLECGPIENGRRPFRFENMWLKSEGFLAKVKGWWESYTFQGSPSFVVASKLKALKRDLKIWNDEEFGNIDGRKSSLAATVKSLDDIEDERHLSDMEHAQRDQAKADLEKTLLMEEICWRQKSRTLWLKEGDKNTKFFHRIANSHRRKNAIGQLEVEGVTVTDTGEIKDRLVDFYKNLFTEIRVRRPTLDNLPFSSIDSEEAAGLEADFTEEEVSEAVHNMNGDKAPGPDGFSLAFFQFCWSVVKGDIMQIFHHFFNHGSFTKSINATFIALIPKKPGAVEIKDFRPISLVTGLYKIVAKVLANRLKAVLGKVVSAPQNAFVKGRQILDSVLIANECLDSRLKAGDPRGVVQAGFREGLRSFNGTPCGFFPSSRGLRQGDPLSPLLFIIVMEALSRLLARARDGCYISGFDVGRVNHISISHLLFADDTLILCGAARDQLCHLKSVFVWFQASSGLKINLGKSELVPVGSVPDVEELAVVLGCKVGTLPMSYLGLPLGSSFKDKTIWNGIVEKLETRLAGWKRMYLSKGGRVTLIKSTLSNIPTYYLSLFPIPVGVAHRIEKIQRDFLWGGLGEDFKYHLVSWDRVCTPLYYGGLGIRRLLPYNQALLGKWLWRYAREKEALWRKIVELKYGGLWGGWCSNSVHGTYGKSLWKHIRKGWPTFAKNVYFKVGDGAHIKFWQHQWCGETTLKSRFPELYQLVSNPEASVQELASFIGSSFHWNVSFTRSIQDWELESVAEFLDVIYTTVPTPGVLDTIHWKYSSQKEFSVSSFYKCLLLSASRDFPWKSVWKPRVPSKVNFFIWTASLGKVLTIDNLRKRQLVIMDWCCMCKEAGESIDHLFLHCHIARELWALVFSMFGVSWVLPRHVVDLMACWNGCTRRCKSATIWGMIPHCLMWVIWRERNARTFEDLEKQTQELKQCFLSMLLEWVNASDISHFVSLYELINFCQLTM
uniref:Reverse transcriptase domain-containing protein n=1 Tax=Fagus sylvatica TaxID=28930 RepID=A0A2N9J9F5_FAGSY